MGVDVLAAIRPDDVNIALLVHVAGAMALVGTLLVSGVALVGGWRGESQERADALTRLGLKAILYGALPAYVVMRIGAQWTEAASDYPDDFEPEWLDIGYITSDIGGLLLLLSIILSAIGLRRGRQPGRAAMFGRIVGVLAFLLLAAYLVAVWAMTTKPA